MKIVIIGAGALGSLIGGLLKKNKQDVCLIDKDIKIVNQIKKSGIMMKLLDGREVVVRPDVMDNVRNVEADLVIVCVKAYDTKNAVKIFRKLVGNTTEILTLQNGLGNIDVLTGEFGIDRIIGGTSSHGANLIDYGYVRHTGEGNTFIARVKGEKNNQLFKIAKILSSAGIQTEVTENLDSLIWTKLIINAVINPLTAIFNVKNGELVSIQSVSYLAKHIIAEAKEISDAKGIELAYEDMESQVRNVCIRTGRNISSMLQDVKKGRKTEINYINGAIVKEASLLDKRAPYNDCIVRIIQGIEKSSRRN